MTHDYRRHGSVDLFAALSVATGEVLTQTRKKHTGEDVRAFFSWIDLHTPRHRDVYVVLHNLSAHESEPVRTWLEHPKRARRHLHVTPTSASWVNLIDNWFAQITEKRLTNSAFTSVAELVAAIDEWTSHWNDDPRPLVRTKPANDISPRSSAAEPPCPTRLNPRRTATGRR